MERLAVSERPGGYAPHHRKVRRQEEILWLSGQKFTRVVSLLASAHNLHSYEELGIKASHFPLSVQSDGREVLEELYPALLGWLRRGERVLIHQEELGERIAGVIAGFLCWSGLLPEPPQAISIVEQLLRRQMGATGREIVAISLEIPVPVDETGTPLPPRPLSGGFAFLASPPLLGGGLLRGKDELRGTEERTVTSSSRQSSAAIVALHERAGASRARRPTTTEAVKKVATTKQRAKKATAKTVAKAVPKKLATKNIGKSPIGGIRKTLSAHEAALKATSKVEPKATAKRVSAKKGSATHPRVPAPHR
jgi:hypothetical protein